MADELYEQLESRRQLQMKGFTTDESSMFAKWLEDVVIVPYCAKYVSRLQPHYGSLFDTAADKPKIRPIQNLNLFVTRVHWEDLPIEYLESKQMMVDVGRDTTLSKEVREMRASIEFYIGATLVNKYEALRLRMCSAKIKESRERLLPRYISDEKREIEFFTKIIPFIEDWSFRLDSRVNLAVPPCFYGNFDEPEVVGEEKPPNTSWYSRVFEYINDWRKAVHLGDVRDVQVIPTSEAVTMLITQDMYRIGFWLTQSHLSLGETKAAARELAIIHASSWAMECDLRYEREGTTLLSMWPCLEFPFTRIEELTDAAKLAIPKVLDLFKKKLTEAKLLKLKTWLDQIERLIKTTLTTLFAIPEHPNPATIIHANLGYRNISFRPKFRKPITVPLPGRYINPFTGTKSLSPLTWEQPSNNNTDCRIVNWQYVSYGAPMNDFAYFLLTAIPPRERQAVTPALIRFYYKQFKETAEKFQRKLPFTLEALEASYKECFMGAVFFLLAEHKKRPVQFKTEVDEQYPFLERLMGGLLECADNYDPSLITLPIDELEELAVEEFKTKVLADSKRN